MNPPIVLAITGASGAVYALRLLDCLIRSGADVHLTISSSAAIVMQQELGIVVDPKRFRVEDLLELHSAGDEQEESELRQWVAQTLASLNAGLTSSDAPARILYHHPSDFMSPIASGSFLTGGMVICPCSGSTLSAVVHGASNNLIHRAADVHLKERRRLILVPRETPLSTIYLDNMRRASEAGAVVLPAMPGWYHGVRSLGDLIDFIVARVLDQLSIDNQLMKRWGAD